jgi:large subunit ribosomal protein L20
MRVRKGAARNRAKKRLFKEVKGNWGRRGNTVKMATETLLRGRAFGRAHRRLKKREYRGLWIIRVKAACVARGMTYSAFIHGMDLAQIELNRKSLSELAIHHPSVFDELVQIAQAELTKAQAA